MSDSLETVFDEETVTEEPQAAPETPEIEASAEPETVETTGETTSTPEEENRPDPVEGLKAGIAAERQKRQQAEKRAIELEQRMRQAQPRPDFWENPERVLGQYAQGFQRELQKAKTDMAVEVMRNTHDDYEEMESIFLQDAERNPALVAQMNASANPAKFAYDYGIAQKRMKEVTDPSYEEKLRAKLHAEWEAEKSQEVEQEIQKRSKLPGTLSNERAAGGNTKVPFSQPSAEQLYD